MRYVFDEVSVHGEKSYKCDCGRRCKRRKKFSQTLNPFNKHNGLPKLREQILVEIYAEKRLWEISKEECSHSVRALGGG